MNSLKNNAFTLIELLTVITIISILISILLPCLNGVKKTARLLICQTNIRSTGISFNIYCQSSDDYLPPAYTYINSNELVDQNIHQIQHWSGVLIDEQYLAEDSVHCLEFRKGGLAPLNTFQSNLDPEQETGMEGVIDVQANRCAFTVNEALCPRNRFETDFEGTRRPSKLVKNSVIQYPTRTILLTEWARNRQIISGINSNLSYSFMPIHGFRGLGKMTGTERYDLNMVFPESYHPCLAKGAVRRITEDDLSTDPTPYRPYPSPLDWVGRHHKGSKNKENMKSSSFYYIDGHVESKSIYETINENSFEWGNRVYSLTGTNSVIP